MKHTDIKNLKPAKKYASALFESAKEKDAAQSIQDNLVFITETLKTNPPLYSFLINPIIKADDKIDSVKKLFAVHIEEITLDFLGLIINAGRMDCINEILNCYERLYNDDRNIITPTIISAVELEPEQKNRIIEKLEHKSGKTINPAYVTNPEIIGGLVIEIDDTTLDFSVKNKFDNIKKQLTKGNNYGSN